MAKPFSVVATAWLLQKIVAGRKKLGSRDGPFFWKKEQGGASASVGWAGDGGRFQGAGVLGGGEHLPETAAAGAAASPARPRIREVDR
jgi:hypothetical protein